MTTATMTDESSIDEQTANAVAAEESMFNDFNLENFFADPTPPIPPGLAAETVATEVATAQPESSEQSPEKPTIEAGTESTNNPENQDCPTNANTPAVNFIEPKKRPIMMRIWDVEHELAEICREEETLKAKIKSVKESRVEKVEELEGLLRERDNLATAASSQTSTATSDITHVTDEVASPKPTSRPQDWGRDQIEVLAKHGMTEKKLESLRAAADSGRFDGTIKGLRDWIAKYALWYRDVKGCGETGANKISDALTSYVAANPMPDEPMTADDIKRSEAAAEFLGHTDTSPVRPTASSGVDDTETDDVTPAISRDDIALEQAYALGHAAGEACQSCSNNPFPDRGSPQAKEWHRGWDEGSPV